MAAKTKTARKRAAKVLDKYTLQEIFDHFGDNNKTFAARIGCAPTNVSMWRGEMPAHWAFVIHEISGGALDLGRMPIKSQLRKRAE